MSLHEDVIAALRSLRILPRRILLDTADVRATAPMLRGVWGAALHDLDSVVYQTVFHPLDETRRPAYVLRPAPAKPEFAPAADWILIGHEAIRFDQSLLFAWGMAMERGLGKRRRPFRIRRVVGIEPDGEFTDAATAWPLSESVWPLPGDPAATPCRLAFHAPLSLWRNNTLIAGPTLTDIVIRAGRRIAAFLPESQQEHWHRVRGEAIELAKQTSASSWQGERLDLKRYSSSQDREFQVNGVSGWLELPEGPGELWPLLAALQWIHVGKSTVVGLGQIGIEPLPSKHCLVLH